MAAHSSVLALRIPGTGGGLVGCHLWGRTQSDTTEVTLFPLNFQFSLGFILILLFLAIVIGERFLHCPLH